jgi:hypothetical protein
LSDNDHAQVQPAPEKRPGIITRTVAYHPVWTCLGLLVVLSLTIGWASPYAATWIWLLLIAGLMIWRQTKLIHQYPPLIRTSRVPPVDAHGIVDFKRVQPGDVVQVMFRELWQPAWDNAQTYIYVWPWANPRPSVGARIYVFGAEKSKTVHFDSAGEAILTRVSHDIQPAVVTAIGTTRQELDRYRAALKPVVRLADPTEVEQAINRHRADETAWLDMMRKAAGLPSTTRRTRVPDGFPGIPPERISGTPVSADEAGRYGAVWWRAYKTARDGDEAQVFHRLASRWYKVRDRA